MNDQNQQNRVLALDPANRGFGFVVMEGPQRLIDWGVKEVKDNDKYRYLRRVEDLIDLYQPNVLAIEDHAGKTRRCGRVKDLIREIAVLALNKRMRIRHVSPSMVKEAFAGCGPHTKHRIAESIARRLPELALRLPHYRKPWMSEDYRMSIFDSAAFALTFYYVEGRNLAESNS